MSGPFGLTALPAIKRLVQLDLSLPSQENNRLESWVGEVFGIAVVPQFIPNAISVLMKF